jgi:alpha-beta hydrolase superfamily lysophospholipase
MWSLVLGSFMPVFNTLPMRTLPRESASALSSRAREVRFFSEDGILLRGLYAPPKPGCPVLVIQHGVRANRDDILPWARMLAAAGYGVLCFDWRGHGLSGGDQIGFASSEFHDVRAADAFLDAQPELQGVERGILAISMGAACFAQSARELDPVYRCMILDSPYGSLNRMIDYRMRPFGPLRYLPREFAGVVAGWWTGVSPSTVKPEENLAAFAPRPVMVFHGTGDKVIPFSEGKSLFEAYPGPKEKWFTEGDAHTEARVIRIRTWTQKVATFLAAHLKGAPDPKDVVQLAPRGRKDPP